MFIFLHFQIKNLNKPQCNSFFNLKAYIICIQKLNVFCQAKCCLQKGFKIVFNNICHLKIKVIYHFWEKNIFNNLRHGSGYGCIIWFTWIVFLAIQLKKLLLLVYFYERFPYSNLLSLFTNFENNTINLSKKFYFN